MIKVRKSALLTAIALGLAINTMNPAKAYALEYKLMSNSVGWSNGTINDIELEDIYLELSKDSPFKLKAISDNRYDVVVDNGEIILHVDVLDELGSTLSNVIKCKKSNFISEKNIYKDININESNEVKVVSFKVDDRKEVIFVSDNTYVRLHSMASDTVLFGNNYLNKFLESITVKGV